MYYIKEYIKKMNIIQLTHCAYKNTTVPSIVSLPWLWTRHSPVVQGCNISKSVSLVFFFMLSTQSRFAFSFPADANDMLASVGSHTLPSCGWKNWCVRVLTCLATRPAMSLIYTVGTETQKGISMVPSWLLAPQRWCIVHHSMGASHV